MSAKYSCDRCGKPVSTRMYAYEVLTSRHDAKFTRKNIKFDLCDECFSDFKRFMDYENVIATQFDIEDAISIIRELYHTK